MKKPQDAHPNGRLAAIRAAIEPVLAAQAVELCDLVWTTERNGLTLRLTIERPGPEGEVWQPENGFGVTLDDCALVSRAVSAALDADDTLDFPYSLEVSSPGLDRPLRGARDFARFRGALVKVKLSKPAPDGQRVLRGELCESPAGTIAVVVDGKRIEAPEADVVDANLVVDVARALARAAAKEAAADDPSAPARGGGAKGAGPRAIGKRPRKTQGGDPPPDREQPGDAPPARRGGAAR